MVWERASLPSSYRNEFTEPFTAESGYASRPPMFEQLCHDLEIPLCMRKHYRR